MKTPVMKNFTRFTAILLLGTASLVHAVTTDDTEIYLNSGAAFSAPPIVMFYTEYTSRLAAGACGGISTTDMSTAALKSALVSTCNGSSGTKPNLAPLKDYFVYPDSPGASIYNNDLEDGTIDRYELIRAVIKRVVIGLGDMKVGVLTVHNDDSTTCTGTSVTDCSNGAYVLQRAILFRRMLDNADGSPGLLSEAGYAGNPHSTAPQFDPGNSDHVAAVLALDSNKREFFARLNGVRTPQGGFSHDNQDKEVYFELFRYLTGKPVFNGHNGWNDYGTGNTPNSYTHYNLGRWTKVNNGGRFACAPNFTCHTTDASGNVLPTASGVYVEATTQGNSYNGNYDGDFQLVKTVGNTKYYMSTRSVKWDTLAENASNVYISPIDQHCQKIFMINTVYGSGNNAGDSDSAIAQTYANHGINRTTIGNDSEGLETIVGDLYRTDLANAENPDILPSQIVNPNLSFADKQNVTSFYLADQVSQVNAIADAGGTGRAIPLTNDPNYLITEMSKIFDQILSVSTTFVAASIPVNVFNRSEVIDNAYLALFQADAASRPRWQGDVKKLKLDIYVQDNPDGTTTNKLQFLDSTGADAIALDGRIDSNALTFWTNGSGYDITDPTDVTGNDPPVITGKDGRAVTRGGAGQKIPGFLNGNAQGTVSWLNATAGGRKLYTDAVTGDPATRGLMSIEWANRSRLWPLLRVDGDSYSQSLWPALTSVSYSGTWSTTLGDAALSPTVECNTYSTTADTDTTPTSSQAPTCRVRDVVSNLIAYMRGFDVNYSGSTNNNTNTGRIKTRRWLLGDPLHSRPLPINYGVPSGYSATNPDIRIIFGSNDGYLRMIKNTGTGTAPAELGSEVWAFMPREVMKIQKQLMDNAIVEDGSPLPKHTYGVDSSPVAFIRDSNGTISSTDCPTVNGATQCDVAWIYAGLRRGGRGYYALDVTNPDAPSFKWKITNATTGFSLLGYTFSQPAVRFLNWGSGVKPVLIFGGGYDFNKDITGQGTNDTIGRAIYIVDADTGALVWKVEGGSSDSNGAQSIVRAAMTDSIPSDVAAVDGNGDGLIDRVYVGDTGGQVWRVDLPGQSSTSTTDPRGSWSATVLLNLGRHWNDDATVTDGTYPNDRRFFSAPDVVPSKDASGNYDAIVIGSGNREHPLSEMNRDYMFMFKDRDLANPLPISYTAKTPDDLVDMLGNCGQYDMTNCSTTTLTGLETGWRLPLTDNGEKSLAPAMTLRGVVYFSTYVVPSLVDIDGREASCKPEGKGYFYAINLSNAAAVFSYFSNDNETVVTNTDGTTSTRSLTTDDRKRELASGGIPSENVYVSFRDPDSGLTYNGILPSDLDATDDLGTQQWRSFWYEKQH